MTQNSLEIVESDKLNLDTLKSKSPYIQIAGGAGGGFAIGFVFFKFSKLLAICAGCVILTTEVAVQSGIVKIDTTRLMENRPLLRQSNAQSALLQSEGQTNLMCNAKEVVFSSTRLVMAFLGGFLLGFGFA